MNSDFARVLNIFSKHCFLQLVPLAQKLQFWQCCRTVVARSSKVFSSNLETFEELNFFLEIFFSPWKDPLTCRPECWKPCRKRFVKVKKISQKTKRTKKVGKLQKNFFLESSWDARVRIWQPCRWNSAGKQRISTQSSKVLELFYFFETTNFHQIVPLDTLNAVLNTLTNVFCLKIWKSLSQSPKTKNRSWSKKKKFLQCSYWLLECNFQ